ncbi:MAG TPA: hypothetical protein EYH20_03535 [Leucothrix sp.]|nr:hypothetical protein [Leucothrix sp.]
MKYNMIKTLWGCAIVLNVLIVSNVFASPFFRDDITLLTQQGGLLFSSVDRNNWSQVKVSNSKRGCNECLKIEFLDHKNKRIAHRYFESSYGEFIAGFYDVTGNGNKELLLITGKGDRTYEINKTLSIFSLANNRLTEILRQKVSGYFGPAYRWDYSFAFLDAKTDDNDFSSNIVFYLKHTPFKKDTPYISRWKIPKAKKVEYFYSRNRQRFIRLGG